MYSLLFSLLLLLSLFFCNFPLLSLWLPLPYLYFYRIPFTTLTTFPTSPWPTFPPPGPVYQPSLHSDLNFIFPPMAPQRYKSLSKFPPSPHPHPSFSGKDHIFPSRQLQFVTAGPSCRIRFNLEDLS